MVYTVTLNPALDYNLYLNNVNEGAVNRVDRAAVLCGGKGINVSQVLNELGVNNVALGFVASFTGAELERRLRLSHIVTDFITLKNGFTRINVKIKAEKETDLNAPGPEIDGESLSKFLEKISALEKADILCLSGSVPKNIPEDIYSSMLEIAAQKGVKTVVDAEGKLLLNCLKYNPFLIKPNVAELEGIFETQIKSDDEIMKHAYELHKMGAENVVVSCGKDGAILVSKKGVHKALSPKGKAINTVGSGDSLVAGFIAEYQKSGNCEKALRLGVAAGSATAFSEKIAQKGEILTLIEKVEIVKIR